MSSQTKSICSQHIHVRVLVINSYTTSGNKFTRDVTQPNIQSIPLVCPFSGRAMNLVANMDAEAKARQQNDARDKDQKDSTTSRSESGANDSGKLVHAC